MPQALLSDRNVDEGYVQVAKGSEQIERGVEDLCLQGRTERFGIRMFGLVVVTPVPHGLHRLVRRGTSGQDRVVRKARGSSVVMTDSGVGRTRRRFMSVQTG